MLKSVWPRKSSALLVACASKVKKKYLKRLAASFSHTRRDSKRGTFTIFFYILLKHIFNLSRCTLPDFPSIPSQASLPFLSCCYWTTTINFKYTPNKLSQKRHTLKCFPNLVNRNHVLIVVALFQLIWHQTKFCLYFIIYID